MEKQEITLRDLLINWKANNWPPENLRQQGDLPIFSGGHAAVSEFGQSLADIMALLSEHVYDNCRGRVPRWMSIPKIFFSVERINLVTATAKDSRRFTSVDSLFAECGKFSDVDKEKLTLALQANPERVLVAHKSFVDMRAYIYVKGERSPKRVHFYESGLVVAVTEKFIFQDHRKAVRVQRNDAYANLIAGNSRGWEVFLSLDAPEKS
jgi:hypothetical protein